MGSISWSANFLAVMRQPSFKTVSSIAFLLVAVLLATTPAQAGVFTFVYSNVEGPVPGTVSGTITLPDGDGTFAASLITVESAPAALGYTTPVDVTQLTTQLANSFVVSGGQIDKANSRFGVQHSSLVFLLNYFSLGSAASPFGNLNIKSGVEDSASSTLVYSSAPAAVPEPTSMAILGLGALGMAYRARRKSNR